jgi:hypothetical protein
VRGLCWRGSLGMALYWIWAALIQTAWTGNGTNRSALARPRWNELVSFGFDVDSCDSSSVLMCTFVQWRADEPCLQHGRHKATRLGLTDVCCDANANR